MNIAALLVGPSAVLLLAGHQVSQSSVSTPSTYSVTCGGVDDTAALQSAVDSAGASPGDTVQVAAGTCQLYNHLTLGGAYGITLTGAGQTSTTLVQHSRVNIFGISTPGTTVENLTADTATYQSTYPPVSNDPDPPTLYSSVSYTSVRNYTSLSGNGFGFRLTGPNPCSSHLVTGDVVDGVNVNNTGTGGFSSIDVDCGQVAVISNAIVHGGSVTPFEDANSTIIGLTYTAGPYGNTCQPAWQVTNGSSNISGVVSSNGWGRALQGAIVTVVDESLTVGDSCPAH